jgi:hypothetical protein
LGKVEVATRRPPRCLKTQSGQKTGQHSHVAVKDKDAAAALPTLSSTNYGGMYVISSYKDSMS